MLGVNTASTNVLIFEASRTVIQKQKKCKRENSFKLRGEEDKLTEGRTEQKNDVDGRGGLVDSPYWNYGPYLNWPFS